MHLRKKTVDNRKALSVFYPDTTFIHPHTHVTSYNVLDACKFPQQQLPAQLSRLHSSTLQEAIPSRLKVQKTEGKVLSIHGCKHYEKMRAEAE